MKSLTVTFITRPFKILIDAFRNCWDQIWKSVSVLAIITIVLATVFYWIESPLQPEYANWLKDVLWAFCVYIQDPGGIGGNGPVTHTGKIIATTLGFLNILIVAVPAGIIASGFTTALETDAKEKQTARNSEKIRQSFKPVQCRHTYKRCVPAYKSLISLQVESGMPADDIIAAVDYAPDLRLRNLADTYSCDSEIPDKLIVEKFPADKTTDYGCLKDRGSNVTIVCTSSHEEIGTSHFGWILAEAGGFNFVSREFDDSDFSYYIVPKDKTSEPFRHFFEDIKRLSEDKGKWIILINQVQREIKSQLSFVTSYKPSGQTDVIGSTVCAENAETFEKVYNAIQSAIVNGEYKVNEGEREYDEANRFATDLNQCFKPVRDRNLGILLGGGKHTNVFTLRIAARLVARDRRNITIATTLAEILNKNLVDNESNIVINSTLGTKHEIK